MATTSPKRARRVKAAGSPAPGPMNPSCGHSGCGLSCMVRYCGPTSPMHNQHIVHAARGASQVWVAAIVAGLAVVLTGAIAYSAVQAEEQQNDPTTLMLLALRRVEMRLDRIEPKINRLAEWVAHQSATGTSMMSDRAACVQKCTAKAPDNASEVSACIANECSDLTGTPSSTSRLCADQCGSALTLCQNSAKSAFTQCTSACIPLAGAEETNMDACKQACSTTRETATHACQETGTSCKNACKQ